MAKTVLKTKGKVLNFILLDLKSYCKAMVIQTVKY